MYFITVLSFFVIILSSCGSNEGKEVKPEMTPLDYNDAIITEQSKIINAMLNLSKAFETADATTMDTKLELLTKQASTAIEALEKMEPYKGDNTLRASAIALFEFYKSLSENEFDEMVDILKKKEKITKEDFAKMEELNKGIVEKETVLDKNLSDAQNAFASKYGFQIERNKLQDKIDNMNK